MHRKLTITYLVLHIGIILSMRSQESLTVNFSVERGIYDMPFQLMLSSNDPDATIRYTTNGTIPNDSSNMYQRPLEITKTTVVRAAAFLPNSNSVDVFTHSYLFPEEVLNQPDSISEWPQTELFTHFTGAPVAYDNGMDSKITEVAKYRKAIIKSFDEIPSIMITMSTSEFFSMYYSDDELPIYLEILYPDEETTHEAAFAGIEGISHKILKRSYRISFKKKYGVGKLNTQIFRKYAPFHANTAEDDLDQLVLRGGTQRCWARRWFPDQTAYTRDQWYRDSQLAMSGYGVRGTFGHVFVNGVYIGLYNLTERPDENFFASYFKGDDKEWFVVNHNGVVEGDDSRWEYILDTLIQQDLNDVSWYNTFKEYVDVESFSDYLIVSWISGMEDWPINNYYGGYNYEEKSPLLFVGWDAEVSWDNQGDANPGAWIHREFRKFGEPESEISEIWHAARESKQFMLTFADRVYLHCTNGGALSDSAQRHRWRTLNEFISNAIVAESARWGDALQDGIVRMKDEHWSREVQRVDSMMKGNSTRFLELLKFEGYYPKIDPPLMKELKVESSAKVAYMLENSNGEGEIYYRVDGGDPCLPDGSLAKQARLYTKPISINIRSYLKTRVKVGDQWSAMGKY